MSSLPVPPCREISPSELTIDLENGKIGRGGFATVYAAQWFSHDVAVKLIALTDEGETKLKKEIGLLSLLNHPGIIRVYGVTYLDGKMGIVMDRASSSLHTPSPLSRTSLSHAISITSALHFLHSNNFIHRDLKPQNILMVDGRPRISDFGTSKIIADTATLNTINAMTPKYAALEAFDNNSSQESDVYSLGVILYELLTNKVAFEGINSQIALLGAKYNGTKLPFDVTTPVLLQEIINKCLDNDQSKRPGINQILEVLNDLTSEVGVDENLVIENNNDELIQELRRVNLNLRQEIQQLAELNREKDEEIVGKDQEIQELSAGNRQLNNIIVTKDQELEEFSSRIEELTRNNSNLNQQLGEKDQQIEELNQQLGEKDELISQLTTQNQELKSELPFKNQIIQLNSPLIRVCLWAYSMFHNDITQKIQKGFRQNWPNLEVQITSTDEPNLNNIDNFDVVLYNTRSLTIQATLLEQIVEAGKGLVLFSSSGGNIKGDFKYGAFKGLSNVKSFCSFIELGNSNQNDLIMKSVNSFSCMWRAKYTSINHEFQTVATLKNGDPLVLKSEYNKSRVVDFASHGHSTDGPFGTGWKSSTDGHLLLANSIVWVSGRDD
ncbi:hypothetical protein P9112_009844 [Eukaryota sp. TZLM1-RC]